VQEPGAAGDTETQGTSFELSAVKNDERLQTIHEEERQ
jgi:hypothetical protein